jgi:hypothetical protein
MTQVVRECALSAFAAALIGLLWSATPSSAQKGSPSPAQKGSTRIGTTPEDNFQPKIGKNWDTADKEEARQFESLRKGEQPVTADAQPILDDGARWYAYRLTIPEYLEDPNNPARPSRIHEVVRQAMLQIVDPRDTRNQPNSNQLLFKEEFDKRLIDRLNEVSRDHRPIVRVNAAMLLAHLAATRDEPATAVLADIIADPGELDAVRLWAFRGLRDFFAEGRKEGSDPFKNKDLEARCVNVLLDYLGRRPELPRAAGQESARQVAALNYVRAEAAAALGETRLPAVVKTVDKKAQLERPTALLLLKLARGEGQPAQPGIAEQVHSAIGVCQLESRRCDEYQPDYAAYQLGRFVVDFVNRHREALQNDQAKRDPWKIYSARLVVALEQFKEDTHRNDAAKYIGNLVNQATEVLNVVANGGTDANPQQLAGWLDANPPKSTSLYRDVASAVVREADKTGG